MRMIILLFFIFCIQLILGHHCPVDEVFMECGSCDPTCDILQPICPTVCKTGCFCRPGCVRNHHGQCIDPMKCPKPVCSRPNEVFVSCLDPCPETCVSIFNPDPKPLCLPPSPCPSGCQCRPGCVINQKGICVEKDQCPKPTCPGSNEVFVKCKSTCPETCDSVNKIHPRPQCLTDLPCVSGCDCIPGYVRNNFNKCIKKEECPKPKCAAPNEIYVPCKNPCPDTCASIFSEPHEQKPQCLPSFPCPGGCDCIPGYVRNTQNVCIKKTDCPLPQCAGQNEEYVRCLNPCFETCASIYNSPDQKICISMPTCIGGCQCIAGYVRNANSDCIKKENCPKPSCKGPNEEYLNCKDPCRETCESIVTNVSPQCSNNSVCVPGCDCLPGYYRNNNKVCVIKEECPPKCKPNEVFNPCPGYCTFEPDCDSVIRGIIRDCAKPPSVPFPCQPRCECKPGFVRIGRDCLPEIECCDSPNNEVVVNCPQQCEETCANTPEPNCQIRPCLRKVCVCQNGLVRNSAGVCIPKPQCPPRCQNNEELNLCPAPCTADEDCDTLLGNVIVDCFPPSIRPPCVPRCLCKPGFVRNNTRCIPSNQCCNNPNTEEVVFCPQPCEETCSGIPSNCQRSPCRKAVCSCKNGLVRNGKDECISKSSCPSCKDPNEIYLTCGPKCEPTCNKRNPICILECVEGCFCRVGYIKHNGRCIQIKDCPSNCGANEIEIICPAPCTLDETCDTLIGNSVVMCQPPATILPCEPKCFCKPGFVRNNTKCIPANQCCQNPKNEEVVPCPQSCEETCEGKPSSSCQRSPCNGAACRCKTGLVRNGQLCIPQSSCPSCNGSNEIYNNCGSRCPPTCNNRNPSCTDECVEGCFCKDGYIRQNNVCIPVKDCPPICEGNEVLDLCPAPCKSDESCATLLGSVAFNCKSPPVKPPCQPKCFCKPGFVRNGTSCIPQNQCCQNPNNEEVVSCPQPCEETCEGKPPSGCQIVPCTRSVCRCRNGTVRDEKQICISKPRCPSCNGPNEIYKLCGTRCQPTCDNRNPSCTKECVGGCFCKEGFIRQNDICIPIINCPPICGGDEVLDLCPAPCRFDDSCSTLLGNVIVDCIPPSVKPPCRPRCYCKPGYIRNGTSCVPQNQCCQNPSNEEVVNCPQPCEETCEGKPPSDCQTNLCTRSVCRCKNGLVRDAKQVCIPKPKCPTCNGPNEVYKICGTKCQPTCDNRIPSCTKDCEEGCFCKDGFIRQNKRCIPIKDCPPTCGENEELDPCPAPCKIEEICDTLFGNIVIDCKPPNVKPPCQPRCYCKSGYVRDAKRCVPEIQCCQNPSNEVLAKCPQPCEENCDGKPPKDCQVIPCKKLVCRCKNGLVRNAKQVCVSKSTCPKCNGSNEIYKTCGSKCPPTCDDRNPSCEKDCVEGCFCNDGYILHDKKCILIKDCPSKCGDNEVLNPCPSPCTIDDDCNSLIGGNVVDCQKNQTNPKCVPKCLCKPGFVRIKSRCESANQCCRSPNDEEVVDCPQSCEETCEGKPPNDCKENPCVKSVCRCKNNLVRNAKGLCVSRPNCPVCKNPNEEYKICGSKCPPTCDDRNPSCKKDCAEGCFCKQGFIKHDNKCIKVDDCPKICNGTNEEYKECGSCDPSCVDPTPICPKICIKGCYCISGFVRNSQNKCIPLKTCRCGRNEEYSDCSPLKPPTCLNPHAPLKPCDHGCQCIKGCIRNSKNDCIKKEECPQY